MDKVYICDGCDTVDNKVKFIPPKHKTNALSCCPERKMREYIRKPGPIEGLEEALNRTMDTEKFTKQDMLIIIRAANLYHALTGGSDDSC